VTAEILRVADGQVRCGRCHTQFDALERLLEEGDPNAAETGRFLHTTAKTEPEHIEVEEPESMEEITLDGQRIEISGTYRELDDDSGESRVRRETTEEWAEIAQDETNEQHSAATEDAQTDEVAADPAAEAEDSYVAAQPVKATRAPFGSRLQRDAPVQDDVRDALALFDSSPAPKPTPKLWKILLAPLALLLLMQVVHHYRSELARHPRLGEPLMNLYGALGLRLTPDWNLHAYGVKQWGVVVDSSAPGTLKVRASVTNGASFAQPYPLLKLVLEDRWGDQVRAREFEPAEYLDPGVAPDRLLAPAQQANATISIVDPGPDAEGFRFDVCLRGSAGPVCAADVPAR
jgi:Protein of unknown function (DUF3426)